MSKIFKAFIFVFSIALSFVSNSCDKFDTFEFNVPFPIENIVVQGNSNPSVGNPITYCLTSKTYDDYAADVEKLTFVEAAWRTDSVVNITTGNVTVTLKILNGATLFQTILNGINPSDYKNPNGAYVLTLTDIQITAMNDFLETYRQMYASNPQFATCLEASAQAFVTSGNPPFYLKGTVDLLVKAKTKI